MQTTIRKIWNIFTSALVVLAVLLALLLVGARLIGLQVFTVLSGSMEPTYHTGSLIYVKKVDATKLSEGTVITFMLDEDTIATHRIVGVVPDEEDPSVIRYRTKGDANANEDGGLVHYKNVVGTPVFSIPKLGFFCQLYPASPRHLCGHLRRRADSFAHVPAGAAGHAHRGRKEGTSPGGGEAPQTPPHEKAALRFPRSEANPSKRKRRNQRSPAQRI